MSAYEPMARRMLSWIEWRGPLSPADLIDEAQDKALARAAMLWGMDQGMFTLGWDHLVRPGKVRE